MQKHNSRLRAALAQQCSSKVYVAEPLEPRRLLSVTISFPNTPTFTQRIDVNASNSIGQAPGHQAETLIVVNPADAQKIVAFSIDFPDGSPGGVPIFPIKARYSFDGGLSYSVSDIAYPPGHTGSFDPAAAFDRAGNLYFAHLTKSSNPTRSHVSVAKSTDAGQSWAQPVIVATVDGDTGIPDKCWITTGPNPDNLAQDIVYVFYIGPGGLRSARSLDCGANFGNDVLLSDVALAHFPHPVARTDGRLFVVWQRAISGSPTEIRLDYSDDGGVNWNADRIVGTTTVTGTSFIPAAPGRFLFATPSIAVAEVGPHAGRILVSYTTSANGLPDTDITVAYSDNLATPRGTPPTEPINWIYKLVHPNTKSQFHSWIDVDPMTGVPYLSWFDCRDDTQNLHAKRFASATTTGSGTATA